MVLTVASINLHRYECITEVILRTFVRHTFPLIVTWMRQPVNAFCQLH